MEDRETARMRKYGESKTTRIKMATVPHVTSGLGLIKFQGDGFLLTRVYVTFTRQVFVRVPSQARDIPVLEYVLTLLRVRENTIMMGTGGVFPTVK